MIDIWLFVVAVSRHAWILPRMHHTQSCVILQNPRTCIRLYETLDVFVAVGYSRIRRLFQKG